MNTNARSSTCRTEPLPESIQEGFCAANFKIGNSGVIQAKRLTNRGRFVWANNRYLLRHLGYRLNKYTFHSLWKITLENGAELLVTKQLKTYFEARRHIIKGAR